MHFQVGNQVIHWTLGLGEVVGGRAIAFGGKRALLPCAHQGSDGFRPSR